MAANRSTASAYISTITDVREVALWGSADLPFWRGRLGHENLTPLEENGRAALLLTAIESTFQGLPFRELSISVLLDKGGAFLAHAFNSSRWLALAERVFFQTPYRLARLAIDERVPARMAVRLGDQEVFSVQMGLRQSPVRRQEELFEGPIYLPGGRKVFFARLSGVAERYPYNTTDTLSFVPHETAPIINDLLASGFAGTEWMLRAGAIHARTKTHERSRIGG